MISLNQFQINFDQFLSKNKDEKRLRKLDQIIKNYLKENTDLFSETSRVEYDKSYDTK